MGLDAAEAGRLHHLELALEHEEVIPIVENLALVRDGDLLVSDTYLPAEVVGSLLRQAGLRRHVALVVTNDGKSRGWIWSRFAGKVAICQHLGDDPRPDGGSGRQASTTCTGPPLLRSVWETYYKTT